MPQDQPTGDAGETSVPEQSSAAADDASAAPSARQDAGLPKPRPAGEPPSVAPVRSLIESKLSQMFERYLVDDRGNYVVGAESARVWIVPAWVDEDTSVIRVFAITNLDVPVTAELTRYLLAKNLDFVFGCFALDVDGGAVWFNHNLLGPYAAPEELEATIAAVAQTADQYDDEIKTRFGGRLYVEAPTAALTPPTSPGYL